MANRDIVAIGTSAGGVEALRFLTRRFKADLPAAVLVTIHIPSQGGSALDEVLSRAGPLPARFARDGERLRQGNIYLAPADRHLIVVDDHLCLGHGPRENNARPAIDPMMRSLALCCGGRSIGIVLTGILGDGAAGLHEVAESGGIAVVQNPADAAYPEMPRNALQKVKADHVLPLSEMPDLLDGLVRRPAGLTTPVPDRLKYEVEVARSGRASMHQMDHIGRRSVLTCPDCHGIMWEIDEGEVIRYRCHVGHAYSADLMSFALDESVRRALATALRTLEERVALARKLESDARQRNHLMVATDWERRSLEYQRELNTVRDAIVRMDALEDSQRARHVG